MKISIVISVFNEAGSIKNCLDSLLKQELKDYEIIVINDGSTDRTTEILQEFRNEKKILLLEQKHLGPGAARNLGAKEATGEILVFVDADMEYDGNFIEKLVSPIRKEG